jgi:microcin C transport system ATP-binding protein
VRGNDITMIFQEPMTSLNPLQTVEKQIGEILHLHQQIRGRSAQAVLDLLDQVGIRDARKAASYPHQLSGGQRQRVMIAMALANQSGTADCRRTDHGARRDRAGADPGIAERPEAEFGMAMLLITHDLGIVRKSPTGSA